MAVGSGFTSAPVPDVRRARLQTGDSKAAGMRQPTALPSSPKTVPCPRTSPHDIGRVVELAQFWAAFQPD